MLNVPNTVNEAWLSTSRKMEIKINLNGEVYENENVTSLSFDSGSISGETFQIGSAFMNQIQIVFPGIIESIAEDQELTVEIGILIEDTYHYSKLGKFIISEFERNRNDKITTVTAVDQMILLEGQYESMLTYPARIRDVALEIANSSGVEIDQVSFSTLPTTTIKKPEGYTYRQAIGLIAQFEGGFANFNREGNLQVRRLAPTIFTITPENYALKGFTKNETTYRPNGIVVRTGDEETDVLRVGATSGNIIELENKVMTQTLLNTIWNYVKDISYFPFELKWQGNPNLEAGDWIYIEDREDNRYSVPNLSFSFTYNGGMSAESKATTSSNSEVTYRYRGSLKQQIVDIQHVLLGANGWNSNYYDSETEPPNPKPGDLWFKKNGSDTEIWIYRTVDGVEKWDFEISTAPNEEITNAVNQAVAASNAAKLEAEAALNKAEEAITEANFANAAAVLSIEQSGDALNQLVEVKANIEGIQTIVIDKADQTQVTQLAELWQTTTELANGHTSQISSLGEQVNLRVSKDDVINQINVSTEGILIAGNKIRITGETFIDNGIIRNAMIADGAITNAKIQDASIASAKIINLNVDKIVGSVSTFIRSNWNAINSNISIDGTNLIINTASSWDLRLNNKGIEVTNRDGVLTGRLAALLDANTNKPRTFGLLAEPGFDVTLGYRTGDGTYQSGVRVEGSTGTVYQNNITPAEAEPNNGLAFRTKVGGGVIIRHRQYENMGIDIDPFGGIRLRGERVILDTNRFVMGSFYGSAESGRPMRFIDATIDGYAGVMLRYDNAASAAIFFGTGGRVYIKRADGTWRLFE